MMSLCRTLCCMVLALVFIGSSTSLKITFTECNNLSNIGYVDLAPCTKEPCQFKKGDVVTVTIDFNNTATVSNLTAHVYGIIAGIPIPFALPKANGCQGCNLTCPVTPGQHVYQNSFNVLPSYPLIRLAVKWELVDQSNNPVVCFVFPMAIVE